MQRRLLVAAREPLRLGRDGRPPHRSQVEQSLEGRVREQQEPPNKIDLSLVVINK